MADLLALSAHYIDQGIYEGPATINRMTGELSEVADGIALVESFSHVIAFRSDAGLLLFDSSLEALAPRVIGALRAWSDDPVHTLAYTHGHVDHVGGGQAFNLEARERGHREPRIVGHENVAPRMQRYQRTHGYNRAINTRQFGRGGRSRGGMEPMGMGDRFGPEVWVPPELSFRERLQLRVGEIEVELRHSKGETDDHLWAWLPEQRALCTGDFVIWVFPNAGNPQKVQRYPLEWARALREMAAREAELLLPAHGLPVAGRERIRCMLDDMATALEMLVEQTLEMMNAGARLNDILHAVSIPEALLEKPYLRPTYDEPEFVVRNIWRLYGGWYDGNPAHLKPAAEASLARELATLSGGATALAARAFELAERDELRLACELVELAALAEPESREVHAHRAEIYERRRRRELSVMSRGIFGHAARDSAERADIEL